MHYCIGLCCKDEVSNKVFVLFVCVSFCFFGKMSNFEKKGCHQLSVWNH